MGQYQKKTVKQVRKHKKWHTLHQSSWAFPLPLGSETSIILSSPSLIGNLQTGRPWILRWAEWPSWLWTLLHPTQNTIIDTIVHHASSGTPIGEFHSRQPHQPQSWQRHQSPCIQGNSLMGDMQPAKLVHHHCPWWDVVWLKVVRQKSYGIL